MTVRQLEIPANAAIIDARLFLPDVDGTRPPVIILLTDIRGLRPVYEELAATLASQGYAVLLPNVYYRSARAPVVEPGAPFDDETRARVQGYRALLTPEAQAEDFDVFIRTLDGVPEVDASRTGVVGYCMTGGFALRLAAQFPDRVRAAASFHGVQLANSDDHASPHLLASAIKARVHIGHADQDQSATPEQIARPRSCASRGGRRFYDRILRWCPAWFRYSGFGCL